jgi:hypothetical protein
MKPVKVFINILITEAENGCSVSNSRLKCDYLKLFNPNDCYCNLFKEQLIKKEHLEFFVIERCNKCLESQLR